MARSELTEAEILDILYGDAGSEIDDSDKEDSYSPDESTSDDSDSGTNNQSTSVVPGRVCLTQHEEQDWSVLDDQPVLPDFQEVVGVASHFSDATEEMQYFSYFFDDDIIRHIKSETNRYAGTVITAMKRKGSLKINSVWHKWSAVKLQEIYWFFSIILHMCVVKLPKISDYWSTDSFLQTGFARKLLSRDRFCAILSMLHLNDNATFISRGEEKHDPLHKVRPFFDNFVNKSKSSFHPGMNLTIDEAMCPFRGRIGFRVYMKNKPNKYGIKLYALCDASTGYMLNCDVYTGSAGNVDNSIQGLVQRLCSQYFGKGHCIYMDRYYTSPSLLDMLWENKTLGVGTVMKNRKGLPRIFKTLKLKKDQIIYQRKHHLLAVKWKSKRDVFCLSTKHKATSTSIQVRTKGGIAEIVKPDVIIDYNKNKAGVDRADQFSSYYPFARKTLKWWKKLFFHLFIMSTVNSFILYKEKTRKNVSLVDFIHEVGKKLAEKGGNIFQQQAASSSQIERTFARHFPEKVPPTANKVNTTRYCKVCSDRGKKETGKRIRKESRWWCKDCGVGLCVPQCFQDFHTKANYI